MTDRPLSEELDLLAAEYALGLLEEDERASAHALMLENPAFAQRVKEWQDQGGEWLLEIEPVAPPVRVWENLAPLFEDKSPGNAASEKRRASAAVSHNRELRRWQGRAYFAMAASLILALGLGWLVLAPGRPQPSPITDQRSPPALNLAVAQISDAAGEPLVTAVFDQDGRELWVTAAAVPDARKALELWALDRNGQALSLGIVEDRSQRQSIDPAIGAVLVRDRLIAVTLEDKATAPHNAPTAPVLGTARLMAM